MTSMSHLKDLLRPGCDFMAGRPRGLVDIDHAETNVFLYWSVGGCVAVPRIR